MYNSAISCKDCYMSRIYNDITCTGFRIADSYTRTCLCITCTRKAVTKVSEYLLCKSRAVDSVCQAVPPYTYGFPNTGSQDTTTASPVALL